MMDFTPRSKGESSNLVGYQQAEYVCMLTQGVLQSSVVTKLHKVMSNPQYMQSNT